eukprot:6195658-Pleurochrysis_carterae.AAC.1
MHLAVAQPPRSPLLSLLSGCSKLFRPSHLLCLRCFCSLLAARFCPPPCEFGETVRSLVTKYALRVVPPAVLLFCYMPVSRSLEDQSHGDANCVAEYKNIKMLLFRFMLIGNIRQSRFRIINAHRKTLNICQGMRMNFRAARDRSFGRDQAQIAIWK